MSSSTRSTALRYLVMIAALALLAAACGDGGATDEPDDDPVVDAADDDDAADEVDTDDTEETDEPAEADGEPIQVGVITATSGLLGAYGNDYVAGFEAGLDYATDGTGAIDGRPLDVQILDDAGEPERAVSAAVDLIGQGVTVLAGTVSSGAAVQLAPLAEENNILYISGPAATDAVTGINRNTFRSGRQTYQDVATAASLVDDIDGSSVVVFAQDSEFGAANVAGVEAVLGARGAEVDGILVPLSANEFTPFAQQIADRAPDLLFVAWAGDTTGAMWQTLDQQGIFESTTVTTGLAEEATWPFYGPAAEGISFLNHYFADAPDNEVNDFMIDHIGSGDLFNPDGFAAAQMIVHALREAGPDDVDGMITALEGWTFDGPKGPMEIRASDHALLQPMFTVQMQVDGDSYSATLLDTLGPEDTAPPEAGS